MVRDGLLPRMEARTWSDGKTVTYRYKPVDKPWMNLGTDYAAACRKVLDMNGAAPHHGSLRWVWEKYQDAKRWKRLADGTRADYTLAWKQIDAHLGSMPVVAITAPQVARYVHITRADSPRRADIEKTLLSNLCKHAILLGVGQVNPTIGVEPHGSEPSEVMPEEAALRAFLQWLAKQSPQRQVIGQMAEFAALGGSRRCEFLDVAWTQVDEAAGLIRLKRAKQRGRVIFDALSISPAMSALLARLPRDGAWLFTTRDGNPYSDDGFKTLWQRCVIAAIDERVITKAQRFNFHALRRYYTTMHKLEHAVLPDLHSDQRVTARVYDATKTVGRKTL